MKTNKEQDKNATNEDFVTFECETDLQPKLVHSGPTTGYKFDYDFSWVRDPNTLMDATKDDKNYVPVDSGTVNPYEEVCKKLHNAAEICRKAELTDVYNDVFRCIVAKLDQEVAKTIKAADDIYELGGNMGNHDYYVGMESEARTIRDYVRKLFNDESFRYHQLYELLGDK
jgi:hypothetical protein